MKVLIVSVRDTGGTGYSLAHAINKITPEHQCVNLTGQRSYIDYPVMADMGDYSVQLCRKIMYKADALVFLGAFKPIVTHFRLQKAKLKDKKKMCIFMGSEWRFGRKQLLEQSELLLGDCKFGVGSSGMFLPGEDDEHTPCPKTVQYMPPARSFDEISTRFGICNQDKQAVEAFETPKKRVVFMHAPTNEVNKGSSTFYRVVTRAMQLLPNLTFSTVRNQPWVTCLHRMANSDVLMDQDPPFPEAYGGVSIEGAIFKLPIISKVHPDCITWIKENTGLNVPFINWKDDEELLERVYHLSTRPELRQMFGESAYNFIKALHDERPVVERFWQIINS